MSPITTTPPRTRTPPAVPATPPAPPNEPGERARARETRALFIALLISAVLHLLLILVYPFWMNRLVPGEGTFVLPGVSIPPQGTQVVRITEVEAPPEALPEEEEEEPEAVQPVPVAPPPAPGPAGPVVEVVPGETPTAAERLRPREGDRRLWAPLDAEIPSLTEQQRYELELAGRLDEWNDSVAAAEARARAATDWTYTDAEGKRWGISPGQIHLGGITLPLPFGFVAPNGKRDEEAQRAWEWDEIERGAASGAVLESWRDRAEEIRRRKDAERAKSPPDTTRSRNRQE